MKKLHLRPMLTVAVAGLFAATLAGCQGAGLEPAGTSTIESTGSASQAPANGTPEPESTVPFDPKIEVVGGSESFEITDQSGSVVTFKVAYPVARLAGVDPELAEKFAAAVAGHKDKVLETAQGFSRLTIPECEVTCEREATNVVEHAGIYQDHATVAGTSAFTFGSRDRNPGVHSVTMNLKTGEQAELADFMDLGDPQVQELAGTALAANENWAYCKVPVADYLASAGAFSPGDGGMLLLWPIDQTRTADCGVDKVTVPWPGTDTPAEAPADDPKAAPAAADIDGRWCPTAESPASSGCVSVALPNTTDENSGQASQIHHIGDAAGGFQFAGEGAPFGDYYPAGVAIELPSYYPGVDVPGQDRIWNGQTATLMLRQ